MLKLFYNRKRIRILADKKKKILDDTITYSIGLYISQAVTIIRGFVIVKFLPEALYGVWAWLHLLLKYGENAHFGVTLAANREISYELGRGDHQRVKKIKENSLSFIYFACVIVFLIFLFMSVLSRNANPYVRTGLIACGIIVFVQQNQIFFFALCRAKSKFKSQSIALVINSIISFIIVFLLIAKIELYAIYLGLGAGMVFATLFVMIKERESIKYGFDFPVLKHLLKIGIPLSIYYLVYQIYISIDLLMIKNMMTYKDLAYYKFAHFIKISAMMIPNAFGAVMLPKMMRTYGMKGDHKSLKNSVYKSSTLLSFVLPFLLVSLAIFMNIPVYFYLRKYEISLAPLTFLLLGSISHLIALNSGNFLIAMNRQKNLIKLLLITITVTIIINYYAVKRGYYLSGVAMATGINHFIYGAMILFYSYSFYDKKVGKRLLTILKNMTPVFAMIFSFVLSNYFVSKIVDLNRIRFFDVFVGDFLKLILFAIIYSIIILVLFRKNDVLVSIIRMIKRRKFEWE